MCLYGWAESDFLALFDCSREFQGLVDLDLEIAKCDKKLGLAQLNLDKIAKIESQPNYEETIPANVRLTNEDKVCIDLLSRSSNLTCSLSYQRKTYEAEIATLQSSKEMFAKLKWSDWLTGVHLVMNSIVQLKDLFKSRCAFAVLELGLWEPRAEGLGVSTCRTMCIFASIVRKAIVPQPIGLSMKWRCGLESQASKTSVNNIWDSGVHHSEIFQYCT